jgi:hypothetical protein
VEVERLIAVLALALNETLFITDNFPHNSFTPFQFIFLIKWDIYQPPGADEYGWAGNPARRKKRYRR